MNWTCEQTEARLSDYLDGVLHADEQSAFNAHVNTCERCAPLAAAVAHTLGGLYLMEQVEPPPQMEMAIFKATSRAPVLWSLDRFLKTFQSPRFVYGSASVAATLIVLLTASGFSFTKPKMADLKPTTIYRNADRQAHLVYARSVKFVSDLRVVYEIQTRLNENEQNPASNEQVIPQQPPAKREPGRTDNSNPSAPKQQNRADQLTRDLRVLASEFPLCGSIGERRVP
jgi:anti-sigma factor RsiW